MAVRSRSKRWIAAACLVVAAAVVAPFLLVSGVSQSVSQPIRSRSASPRLVSRRVPPATSGSHVRSGSPAASGPPVRPAGRAGRHQTAHFSLSSSTPTPAQLLAAMPQPPKGWTGAVHSVTQDGLVRSYLTLQPSQLPGPVPVVVLMHGRFMTADQILSYTRLAFSTGPAVIISAQGYERSWNAGACCGPAWRANVNDVAFIRAALDATFASTPMADRSRVYAVGFSNGGRMAYQLACEMPGVLAGFAAVEAIPVVSCPSMHPLDVTVVAQQADPLLTTAAGAPPKRIYGRVEPTVPAELAHLRTLDGCSSSGRVLDVGISIVTTWPCASSATLRYVWYPGGGHSWRRGAAATPGATAAVVAMIRLPHDLVG